MQIEVYRMEAAEDALTITLEAVCDTFSSLLWDIEYYKCGSFEVYIAANPQNIEIFQTGRIVGRDDDNQHFGIIESVLINTDIENGDYLTVRGRFLMCLLERRIIHPTYNVTAAKAYSEIVREVVMQNALLTDNRRIPGFPSERVRCLLRADSYTANLLYEPHAVDVYDLREAGRHGEYPAGEILRRAVPHGIRPLRSALTAASCRNTILTSFSRTHTAICSRSAMPRTAASRRTSPTSSVRARAMNAKRTTYCDGDGRPTLTAMKCMWMRTIFRDRASRGRNNTDSGGEVSGTAENQRPERLVLPKTASESDIAAHITQYVYNRDYFVGDYVTVQHRRFGMLQPQIQLIGMIEGFDQNGRSLTPTFKEA